MVSANRIRQAVRQITTQDAAFIVEEPGEGAWQDITRCRNCGAVLSTAFCGACGQKAARRLSWNNLVQETWERLRLFELPLLRTGRRLLVAPGHVAREYVMGRRSANMHPLKLLVALVAVLVVMLATNQYFARFEFTGRDVVVDKMAKRVMVYANWSFSLGIFAIFLGSWSAFRRRLGYNAIEHATLAIYCQCVVLAVVIANMLPTMIWRDTQFVLWHKAASGLYMPAIKFAIVAVAYKQFFQLDLKTQWLRWGLALAIFGLANWLLLRLYAYGILWLVSR